MAAKPTGEPGWKWRRWLIFPICVFCAYELDMLRRTPEVSDDVLKLLIYVNAVVLVSVVMFYSGFATIQDVIAIIKTGRGLPYKEEPSTETDTVIMQHTAKKTEPTSESKIEGL